MDDQAQGAKNTRPLVWLALFALVLVSGVGLGVWFGVGAGVEQSLISRRCDRLKKEDLEISEIVALKKRWEAYVSDEAADASMGLSMREASWLLSAESDVDISLRAKGDQVEIHLTAPVEKGCYNIRYRGGLTVQDATAVLKVERLVVGGVDLSDLAGSGIMGSTRVITPQDLDDPNLAEHLGAVEDLRVHDGQLHVRFSDPSEVWR